MKEGTMLNNPAFYFNSELCTGCKTCTIACKDKHDLPVGVSWRNVLEYSGGEWQIKNGVYENNAFAYYVTTACNHCIDPICVKVCSKGAMKQAKNGIVSVDSKLCVGCRTCERNCPYGAPSFNKDIKKMTKCDFCQDYLSENKAPACVDSCTARALDFGEYETLVEKYGLFPTVAPLPNPELTSPRTIIRPHRFAHAQGSTDGFLGARPSNPEEIDFTIF